MWCEAFDDLGGLKTTIDCLIRSEVDFVLTLPAKDGAASTRVEASHDPCEEEWCVTSVSPDGFRTRTTFTGLRVCTIDRDFMELTEVRGKTVCIQGFDSPSGMSPALTDAPMWVEVPEGTTAMLDFRRHPGKLTPEDAADLSGTKLGALVRRYREYAEAASKADKAYAAWTDIVLDMRRLQGRLREGEDE